MSKHARDSTVVEDKKKLRVSVDDKVVRDAMFMAWARVNGRAPVPGPDSNEFDALHKLFIADATRLLKKLDAGYIINVAKRVVPQCDCGQAANLCKELGTSDYILHGKLQGETCPFCGDAVVGNIQEALDDEEDETGFQDALREAMEKDAKYVCAACESYFL